VETGKSGKKPRRLVNQKTTALEKDDLEAPVYAGFRSRPRSRDWRLSQMLQYRFCGRGCLGNCTMGRPLIENAPYGPDQLKALGEAFDEVWTRIAPSVGSSPVAIEAAQLKLADELLELATYDNFDPAWLADAAAQLVLARASRFRP
jgi:hypothetical protein